MKMRRVDFYADEWLTGTAELAPFDRGVYITICSLIWSRGERIEIELLYRHCGVHGNALNASLARLEKARKIVRNGLEIGQKRAEDELETSRKRHEKWSENLPESNKANSLDEPPAENNRKRSGNAPENAQKRSENDLETARNHSETDPETDRLSNNPNGLDQPPARAPSAHVTRTCLVSCPPICPPSGDIFPPPPGRGKRPRKISPSEAWYEGAYLAAQSYSARHGLDRGSDSPPDGPLLDRRREPYGEA